MPLFKKRRNFDTKTKLPINFFQKDYWDKRVKYYTKNGFKRNKHRKFAISNELERRCINFDKMKKYLDDGFERGLKQTDIVRELGLANDVDLAAGRKRLQAFYEGKRIPTLHFIINFANFFRKPVDTFLYKNIKEMNSQISKDLPITTVWPEEKRKEDAEQRKIQRIDGIKKQLRRRMEEGYDVGVKFFD